MDSQPTGRNMPADVFSRREFSVHGSIEPGKYVILLKYIGLIFKPSVSSSHDTV